ncbi:MAG TPA: 3-hydroxyanthranilate 3,4-dioxygenase, partial [Gemmataceae bacterium]|nr:3-hydroxyanthranilate 3,4-dioxygenase [Gemmataceae bacterium]
GPNQRTDFHINPGEELFYQVEGDMVVRIMENGQPRDIPIRQGDLFLLPAGVPHSPQRPANTVGLVVEQPKMVTGNHHLRWYCPKCHGIVHDAEFAPADFSTQLKALIEKFNSSEAMRTCKTCKTVYPVPAPMKS